MVVFLDQPNLVSAQHVGAEQVELVRREDQLSALVLSGHTQETAEELLREFRVERVLQLVDEEHSTTVPLTRPVKDREQIEVPHGPVRFLVKKQLERSMIMLV